MWKSDTSIDTGRLQHLAAVFVATPIRIDHPILASYIRSPQGRRMKILDEFFLETIAVEGGLAVKQTVEHRSLSFVVS